MDALEKIIRPIVEGQIRGFVMEHPSVLTGVDWYKPRRDKSTTLVNSLSKRIVRDLTCSIVRARLAAALLEIPAGEPPFDEAGFTPGTSPPGLALRSDPGGRSEKGS